MNNVIKLIANESAPEWTNRKVSILNQINECRRMDSETQQNFPSDFVAELQDTQFKLVNRIVPGALR